MSPNSTLNSDVIRANVAVFDIVSGRLISLFFPPCDDKKKIGLKLNDSIKAINVQSINIPTMNYSSLQNL